MATIATLNTVNALTKELYQGKIREQMQDEVIGLKRIERSSAGVSSEIGGKYVTFPIRVSRNAGIGYREEDETLQDPGTQGYKRVNVGLKYGYGRVRITGQTMDLAESNAESFASALDREMSGLKTDLAKDSARIFYGDGTGAFTTATGAKTGQVIPVADVKPFFGQLGAVLDIVNGNGATGGAEHPHYDETNSYLNAPLNVYPTAGNLIATGVVLTAIDVANKTITVSGTLGTVANGNLIVRKGNYLREPYGLKALVGTAKLFNLDDPIWQSTMNANGGTPRSLSEGLMIKMTDDVRVQGGKTSLILTSLGVRRAYFALLTQQRRYTNTKEFGGGMTGLAFNNGSEIPVVEDVDAPDGKMWFLDESAFKVYRDKDWSWLDTDGGIWKWMQNKDSFEAVLKQYWQIGIERRNSQGLLSDITEA
jgi:hypothetical protein